MSSRLVQAATTATSLVGTKGEVEAWFSQLLAHQARRRCRSIVFSRSLVETAHRMDRYSRL